MNRKTLKSFFIVGLICTAFFEAGCASLSETGKKIWGTSISHLEAAREEGTSEEFPIALDVCFAKVSLILRWHDANIYLEAKDKSYLAAMNFKKYVDTTQVGVFFTRIDDTHTKVEVTSMIPRLTSDIAEMIFAGLRKGDNYTYEKES